MSKLSDKMYRAWLVQKNKEEQSSPWQLPVDKPIIHPAMPVLLSDKLVQLCKDMSMSIWDRDKVYEAIMRVEPRRE